jgi:ABC-type lipoprotein release transport system permease subunit
MARWIERQRAILDFTLSSLWRRKWKNLALLAVYTLVIFGLASVMLFAAALKKEAAMILRGTPEIIVQKLTAGRHDLIPLSYVEKLKRIRGVRAVTGRLWGYYYDPAVRANYTLMVPEGFALGEREIAVGASLARVRSLYKGSSLVLRDYDGRVVNLRVRGILTPESDLVAADLILISQADFRRLFGLPKDYATDLTVAVANGKEVPKVAAKIADIFPDTRPITREEILRTYDAVFDWRAGIVLVILAGAVLAFLIFAWDKAAGLSAEEKREIGILKAVGWESGDVLLMKFWEGLSVSLASFLLGLSLAYIHVFFTSAALIQPALKGWSVIYPDFRLSPFISLSQMAVLFFFTVIPYTVATIVPAWRAATIDPDTVMRAS